MAYTKFNQFTQLNNPNLSNYIVGYQDNNSNLDEIRFTISALSNVVGIGDLSKLTTTDKTTLVNSINEINNHYITRASISASLPLLYNNDTGVLSIKLANNNNSGYLSASDWNLFNNKQNLLDGTGIIVSNSGTITYITNNSINWNNAYLFTSSFNTNYQDLVAIENLNTNNGFLKKNGANTWVLDTTQYISSINLTTLGTSGIATYVDNTLNIPHYVGLTSNESIYGIKTFSDGIKINTSNAGIVICDNAGLLSNLQYDNVSTDKFLKSNGTWTSIPEQNTLITFNNLLESTTSYTLNITEHHKTIVTTSADPITITVPLYINQALEIGSEITIIRNGSGTVTFSVESGVILNSRNGLLTIGHQYSGVTLIKHDTNVWYLIGDLA